MEQEIHDRNKPYTVIKSGKTEAAFEAEIKNFEDIEEQING